MKILLAPVFVAVILGCNSRPKEPQTLTTDSLSATVSTQASDTAAIIQHIKEVYTNINKEQLTQKSFEWEADTTCEAPPMGGTLTYFYRGNELVKMWNAGGEDHGSWKEEYYFDEDQLVFIYQNNTYGGAANPDEVSYQNRYYFYNNQLIKKIEGESGAQLSTSSVHDLSKTIYRLKQAGNSAAISRILSCNTEE
ncbi:hypothetical protein U0035_11825 [Niabella yanshanensis]|uniref:Lipoprotein n=1 Tax=Niabella yanshanensis TaxID=577386 RepID=A0ABZ0VZ94_9BACT|nr:hypothetical protein [Niabella yanshanensis]WQD36353.1 hypothetical protein U0035_11825 [Niabella yanshanensis]